MATPRRFELVRCFLSDKCRPYSYATPEGFGRTAEEARTYAGWEPKPIEGEQLSQIFVHNYPARDDKDSARVAHELTNWALDPQSEVPQEKRDALLAVLKKRLYADALDYFFVHIQDEENLPATDSLSA